MSPPEIIFLYCTTTNIENAERLATQLLEEKLIACANCLPKMTALYWWENKIERNEEAVIVLKTHKNLLEKLRQRLGEIHPYQTPCIAEIKLDSINNSYRDWLLKNLE